MATKAEDDDSLKRLGGGRWQTRDERFTIEPESGTWVVLDAEQADDLGLPLVRGPFGSLNAAKAAITGARESEPAVSPLAARIAEHQKSPAPTSSKPLKPHVIEAARPGPKAVPAEAPLEAPASPPAPAEPKWIQDLDPADRERAHTLIEKLTEAGAPEPEDLARREITGRRPVVAGFAVTRALAGLGPDGKPSAVARLLVDGQASDLGVRWRLVDDEGRPITLDEVRDEETGRSHGLDRWPGWPRSPRTSERRSRISARRSPPRPPRQPRRSATACPLSATTGATWSRTTRSSRTARSSRWAPRSIERHMEEFAGVLDDQGHAPFHAGAPDPQAARRAARERANGLYRREGGAGERIDGLT